MADKRTFEPFDLTTYTGNVGRPPKLNNTSKGDVVNFSIATQPTSDFDGPPRWINVGVWNEKLRALALEKIKKGMRVVVIGKAYESTYNDMPQFNLNAFRIGLVDYLREPGDGKAKAEAEPEPDLNWGD